MYNELCELGGSVLTNQDWGEKKRKKNSTDLDLLDQIALQDCVELEVSVKNADSSLMTEKSKG